MIRRSVAGTVVWTEQRTTESLRGARRRRIESLPRIVTYLAPPVICKHLRVVDR